MNAELQNKSADPQLGGLRLSIEVYIVTCRHGSSEAYDIVSVHYRIASLIAWCHAPRMRLSLILQPEVFLRAIVTIINNVNIDMAQVVCSLGQIYESPERTT
jgi:hypothetical protein